MRDLVCLVMRLIRLTVACYPEAPTTQELRTQVPKTIPFMTFGTRVLKCWLLGPFGFWWLTRYHPKAPSTTIVYIYIYIGPKVRI